MRTQAQNKLNQKLVNKVTLATVFQERLIKDVIHHGDCITL